MILIILAVVISLLPVFLIKQYILSDNERFLILAMICYTILMLCYVSIFKTGIAVNYTLIQLLQVLLVAIIGGVLFKESIPVIGILLSITAIYFLMEKNKVK